jgi:hypothetical protein
MQTYADELQAILSASMPWLQQFDEAKAQRIPGTSWMVKEIIGHLIDSACNNHQRWIRLQQGNLIGFPKYEQNHWVACAGYRKMPWPRLLALWFNYNAMLVDLIANIEPHTQGNYWEQPDKTLAFLVQDYLRHIRHHLQQMQSVAA